MLRPTGRHSGVGAATPRLVLPSTAEVRDMKMYTDEEATETTATTTTTTTTTRRFQGFDARFGTDPAEIHIELRLGSPSYIHVRVGDLLQGGDAFHRDRIYESPRLATWEVMEITPEEVVATHVTSGEEVTMARDEVERGLAVGRYSTNLTDFEWISVYQVGRWADYEDGADTGTQYTGRPYVSVVAYGDNGRKYGRRYRFTEPDSSELVLWKEDRPARGFTPEVAARLDERVRSALRGEGYTIREEA